MSGITTHVLDTTSGKPARGLHVTLALRDAQDAFRTLAERTTDEQGRIKDFLAPGALAPGTYRLSFDTGAYLTAQHGAAFYPLVELTFQIVEAGEHYHVPLLLSPYGYSTYRGS